jgi:hypothetical protein
LIDITEKHSFINYYYRKIFRAEGSEKIALCVARKGSSLFTILLALASTNVWE